MLAVCKQLRLIALTVGVVLAALAAATSAGAARPMLTGVEVNSANVNFVNRPVAYGRIEAAGATYVRIVLAWSQVAPTQPSNQANPNDAAYNWSLLDNQVDGVLAKGLTPMVTVWHAPQWAETIFPSDPVGTGPKDWHEGTIRPDPAKYGLFGQALATRYKNRGGVGVHTWEVWNEPNLRWFLNPQQDANGKWVGADRYRNLVNEFATNVYNVDPGATIVGGSTSPFGHMNPAPYGQPGPLLFLRKVLCLSSTNQPVAGCSAVTIDAWSTHPYTFGGPTHHATQANDVSLGDLPEVRKALTAAVNAGHLTQPVAFWVGEFGWDSYAPDSKSLLPLKLHTRWTAEALYRAWRAGVSVFMWHQLRDEPLPARAYQAGLYFCGVGSLSDDGTGSGKCGSSTYSLTNDRKKSSLLAFTFPFVAFKGTTKITIWGRTPGSVGGQTVTIQRKVSGTWRKLFNVTANQYGIFARTWRSSLSSKSILRAKLGSTASVGFSLTSVRDRKVNPFGCGGGIPC